MKKTFVRQFVALTMAAVMVLSLSGCGNKVQSQNLMDDVTPSNTEMTIDTVSKEETEAAVMDFAVRLFQNSVNVPEKEGDTGNVLIAPNSVLAVLAMTANGAKGDTLAQMEETFGVSYGALNGYMKNYRDSLPNEEKYKLHMANSIWIKDDESFTVEEEFLQTNADYFDSDVYEEAFNQETLKDINGWVEEKTDGMIKDILNEIPADAVMYLINALVFEAEWEKTYDTSQIREGTFTLENGMEQEVEMMYSEESLYLEDEKATGFIKYYANREYAFVALLPKEGGTVSDYVAGLSGEKLQNLLDNPVEVHVDAAMPKFETEYGVLLNNTLEGMGMTDVFDPDKADLSGIGTHANGNIWVDRLIHKTFIQVDAQGTKAGAATVAEIRNESAMMIEDSKTVRLDRPFVYMIIDCENNQPLFMGTTSHIYPYTRCGVVDVCGYPTAE